MQGKLRGLAAEAFDFWSALNDIDKWYALPPGTSQEIVDAYRAAWDKMVKDPEFIKQGKLLFSADFGPIGGPNVAEMVGKTAYPRAEIVNFMDQLKTKNGLPAEPLSEDDLKALAKASGLDKMEIPKIEVRLVGVGDGGRNIEFAVNGVHTKLDVSSSRTNINIGGKKGTRAELMAGAICTVEYIEGSKDANGITCP